MAKKDNLDVQTGHKLRRMNVSQWETAEQIFEALQQDRAERERVADASADVPDLERLRGPARLQSPFEGL